MSLKNKLLCTAAIGLAVGLVTVSGSAQTTGETKVEGKEKVERRAGEFGKRMRHGQMRGFRGGHGLRGIELTDVQKDQIKTIREANKLDPSIREEMKTIMQARRAGTLTEDQKLRMETLRAQAKQHADIVRIQIESILTPEQKQQLETRKQEMKERMEKRREMRQLRREQRLQRQGTEPSTDN
jgi:protein CpxP